MTGGILDKEALDREGLTEKELFSALREKDVESLGQVRPAYIEPSGVITVFKMEPDQSIAGRSGAPGLSPVRRREAGEPCVAPLGPLIYRALRFSNRLLNLEEHR